MKRQKNHLPSLLQGPPLSLSYSVQQKQRKQKRPHKLNIGLLERKASKLFEWDSPAQLSD